MPVLMVRSKIKPETPQTPRRRPKGSSRRSGGRSPRASAMRRAGSQTASASWCCWSLRTGWTTPLMALPAVVEFQENLKQWMVEPPTVEQMTVVGSYRLF